MDLSVPILVVDVETTGLAPKACGLVEIGAHWLSGPRAGEEFEIRCRPFSGAIVQPQAIEVNGCDWLADPHVLGEMEAFDIFLEWVGSGDVLLAGMNPRFDWEFLRASYDRRYAPQPGRITAGKPPKFPFSHRQLDLHSVAIAWAVANQKPFTGKGIYTDAILTMLGLPPEPKPHRAIRGARCEAEAFRVLLGMPSIIAAASL